MSELDNGLMVFLRVSALLAVFPIFSAPNFPVQLRLALAALLSALIAPTLPQGMPPAHDLWGLIGMMAMEVGAGLLLGFVARLIFFALDMAGAIISVEIGLALPPSFDPMSGSSVNACGTILYYLAAMIFLGLDLHHWLLAALMKTYVWLPLGGAHLSEICLTEVVKRTGQTFFIALQLAAPVMAVSFVVSLVFSVVGRAVPQMNVFQESFPIRTLGGLSVFGVTLQLMSEHIANYLRRLPEDMLNVSRLLGAR